MPKPVSLIILGAGASYAASQPREHGDLPLPLTMELARTVGRWDSQQLRVRTFCIFWKRVGRPVVVFSTCPAPTAVAMVEESGGQIAKVAKELGIYDSSLGNWVRQAREEAAGAPTAAEREEIRELRKELERVNDVCTARSRSSRRSRGRRKPQLLAPLPLGPLEFERILEITP